MRAGLILLLSLVLLQAQAQQPGGAGKGLAAELQRLNTATALIAHSQAIDDYPLWSPASDYVACNVEGKWYKFRLADIELTEAKWRGQPIGVLNTQTAHSALSEAELAEFIKVSVFAPRSVTTKDDTRIQLRENSNLTVSLVVQEKGKSSRTLWTSGGENCHSLALSPDGQYVAYLCELTGLLVMRLK